MNVFEEGHMTRAAQKMDEIMAAQEAYWEAQSTEYRQPDQDVPGKAYVVHYLPPGEVMLSPVSCEAKDSHLEQTLDVA